MTSIKALFKGKTATRTKVLAPKTTKGTIGGIRMSLMG